MQDKREYILIDAPGHIEFLKNMISGAARAEAAVLVIDAEEGVQENSRRHGYLLSMLGIRQIVVAVNKMDLADHSQDVFNAVREEYTQFLSQIQVTAQQFIPISARDGDHIADRSSTGSAGSVPKGTGAAGSAAAVSRAGYLQIYRRK
jgi:bifunctional enzyme CysN/CysC